ncbi:MAG: S26 family signal peptidase, partial [Candidatus Marinimicrobia bacterium]|nr:S26 family signal peptidase [Candidatus Neomarinimicrobiota bacterium]
MNKLKTDKESKVWREVKSWILIILIALGLKSTIIASYMVPTGSMENTIMTGDFLIGNKFLFGARTPDWIGIPYTRIGFNIPSFRLP